MRQADGAYRTYLTYLTYPTYHPMTEEEVPKNLLDRGAALLSEGFEAGVIVARDFEGRIHVRAVKGDPVVAVGLAAVAQDVLLGEASADIADAELIQMDTDTDTE